MTQSVNEQVGALSTIEAKRHFIQIGREMLRADFMPASHDAALEQRERGFDGVRCDHEAIFVPHILFRSVVDTLPFRLMIPERVVVEDRFVGDDHVYVFTNVLCECFANGVLRTTLAVDEFQIAAALDYADDRGLVIFIPAANALYVSTDVGFVDFDCAIHHRANFAHSCADAVAEIPCGFVGAPVLPPDCALELTSAHSLFCFAEQQDSHKPNWKRQVGIVKNRSCGDRELVAAFAASELLARINPPHIPVFAARAIDAFGPAEASKNFAAIFVSRERPIQIKECHA